MTNRLTIAAITISIWLMFAGSHSDVCAQQLPAPDGSTRVVQLHDAKQLVTVTIPGQTPAQAREDRNARLQRIVSFARTFVTPALAAEEDITGLSGRYLIALGRPAQQAWIEQLVQRHVAKGSHQIDLEIRQLRIPAAVFNDFMPPFGIDPEPATANQPQEIGPGRYQALLDDTELALILRAVAKSKDAEVLTAPRILLNPMMPASVEIGTEIEYIKDYVVKIQDGKQVPYPVRDRLFDGLRIVASCGLVRDALLGVSFHYQERKVTKPIPDFKTKLGLDGELTVQLPASTVLELEQHLEMLDGQTALLAIKNGEGPHLMFLVRASLVAHEPKSGGR